MRDRRFFSRLAMRSAELAFSVSVRCVAYRATATVQA
jgi:hypothetical protein